MTVGNTKLFISNNYTINSQLWERNPKIQRCSDKRLPLDTIPS